MHNFLKMAFSPKSEHHFCGLLHILSILPQENGQNAAKLLASPEEICISGLPHLGPLLKAIVSLPLKKRTGPNGHTVSDPQLSITTSFESGHAVNKHSNQQVFELILVI